MGTTVNLGDASVDLWKTIRIWSKRVAFLWKRLSNSVRVGDDSGSPEGSAASYLRMRDRDEKEADKR